MESEISRAMSFHRILFIGNRKLVWRWHLLRLLAVVMVGCTSAFAAAPNNCSTSHSALIGNWVDIEVESARLAQLAALSIRGSHSSFRGLQQATATIDGAAALIDACRQDAQRSWDGQSEWKVLRVEIQRIADAEEVILRTFDLASNAQAQLPVVKFRLLEIAVTTAKSSTVSSRVLHLMNAALVLERLSGRIREFMDASEESVIAEQSLPRDMTFVETTVAALRDGNANLAIDAETNVKLREQLAEAHAAMEGAFTDIKAVLEEAQTLRAAAEASSTIAEHAEELVARARQVRSRLLQ